jgi:membrane associated rhomboid family serine protease
MILPVRTSISPRKTPYANYVLIIVNTVIFFASYHPHYAIIGNVAVRHTLRHWAEPFMLTPAQPHFWQFISYAFLHGGMAHIIGNMFFLYLFGNNVNDRLGTAGYILFYLAGAVFSGIGHTLVSNNPVLGASGAVAAVTGAYLVLFPQTIVTVIYWFIFIGTMDVPALYFIAFKLIFIDNVIARYTPNVAYDAHLAGYAAGIATMLALLASGLVRASGPDLWAMIRQWDRRRRYRDAVSGGYDPFAGRRTGAAETPQDPGAGETGPAARLRQEIAARIARKNLPEAAQAYLRLMKLDPRQVLARQSLLDVANQLASESRNAEAAGAYEQFLAHYGDYVHAGQVELMLGILYARYLEKPESAARHLRAAMGKLTDAGQVKMCSDELEKLRY